MENTDENDETAANLGSQTEEAGDGELSINYYLESVKENPNDFRANRNLAVIYCENYDHANSLKFYDKCIELEPQESGLYSERSVVHMRCKEYDAATRDLEMALGLQPDDPYVFANFGELYREQGDLAKAIENYRKCMILKPNFTEVAEVLWESAIEYGVEMFRESNWERTISYYSIAIEIEPTFELCRDRGVAYSELGEIDHALTDYNQAIALNIENFEAYLDRGKLYRRAKNYVEAIKDFDKATEIDPTNVEGFRNRGVTYKLMREYHLALADLNRAYELDPENHRVLTDRGNTYRRAGLQMKARTDYLAALKVNPEYERAQIGLGKLA